MEDGGDLVHKQEQNKAIVKSQDSKICKNITDITITQMIIIQQKKE